MKTPNHLEIYRTHAQQYDLLVVREDYQQNLEKALSHIIPRNGLAYVELGAGTGRLTRMLIPRATSIFAFDNSRHMLDAARKTPLYNTMQKWNLAVCDHRHIPVRSALADVAISGWSVCYIVEGDPDSWRVELDKVLVEMRRVIHPGGMLILIETLGTGYENPEPPERLVPYYRYLESAGFQNTWIRTDYRFRNMAEAVDLTLFFFGETMLEKIFRHNGEILLPECTGIWWVTQGDDLS
jgi:ubiquinone/menaquinone biosynthesis C-methylase UbiE